MSIIKAGKIITGTLDKLNTQALEDYLESVIVSFTVDEWNAMPIEQRASYKFALVYDPDSVEDTVNNGTGEDSSDESTDPSVDETGELTK